MPARKKPEPADLHPFLFLGAGFGTSAKCLECPIVFARTPTPDERAAIEALVPPALRYVTTWTRSTLNVGSDDALEYGISGTRKKPTRAEWEAFCMDVERCALAIHAVCPIALFVKDDDGEYGRKLGPWHKWSLRRIAAAFHEAPLATDPGDTQAAAAISALSMLTASRLRVEPAARRALARWCAGLIEFAGKDGGERLVERVVALLAEDDALLTELASDLYRYPVKALVARLGADDLVRRAVALIDGATPATAMDLLDRVMGYIWLDDAGGRRIGEALLAADTMKAAIEERSVFVEERVAAGKAPGKSTPSSWFSACAAPRLDMKDPVNALAHIELGLRFPRPDPMLYGLLVRALHAVGQHEKAAELAASGLVQDDAGPRERRVFYEVARYYVATGRHGDAIAQLRRYVEGNASYALYLGMDPRFAALRGIPEFDAVTRPAAVSLTPQSPR